MLLSRWKRRMVQLAVQRDRSLVGCAPEGAGGPFRILDGSRVLWEGAEGEAFEVLPYTPQVYLVSESDDNVSWSELGWKPARKYYAKKGIHHEVRGQGPKGKSEDAGHALRELLAGRVWHNIEVLEPSVIFEAKDGAYKG